MKTLKIAFVLFVFLFSLCSKEDEENGPEAPLEFLSLVAEDDTLASGETTKITATATGSNLSYYWSATQGDILGSGYQVTYASSPCQAGTNQVTCEVADDRNQSESKTINIVVTE